MHTEIGVREAKTKFSELLRQVKFGKSFTITSRGQAIADLVPTLGAKSQDTVAAVDKPKLFMTTDSVQGVNLKELIEEGRS